jgi:phage terminase large subunit-like protein
LASLVASLPVKQREDLLNKLSDEQLLELKFDWKFWSRPSQRPPKWDWFIWFLCAGRGFGKTRTGAEFIRDQVREMTEALGPIHVGFIAKTPADARKVMIDSPAGSGIINVSAPHERPVYNPSTKLLYWPNGSMATVYSSKEYDSLRGPAHHLLWADEIASWHYPQETWDNAMFGLRLGPNPRAIVTSTPRPIPIIKDFFARNKVDVAITTGSTYENIGHLPPRFLQTILDKYKGTSLGEQEIFAKLISDDPRALWSRSLLEDKRIRILRHPELKRVAVAVDPPASSREGSAECGIVGAGIGIDERGYLLEDASLGPATPKKWGRAAVTLYHKIKANWIVAEGNNGGEMVSEVIHGIDPNVPVEIVHASKGKFARAEPVSSLYEQYKISHVGTFGPLEDQLCNWVPGGDSPSPDRLDALVWAFTKLMVKETGTVIQDSMR